MTEQQNCPKCQSSHTNYVPTYGFWECDDCAQVWGLDEDDPDYDEEPLDLGACCGCGCIGASVQNIVTLERKTLVPGTGWGCFVCTLPMDGAIAVLCDDCLLLLQQGEDVIKQAVSGDTAEKGRVPIAEITEPFRHLDIPH